MPSSDSLREEIMKATRRGEVAFTATVVALVAGESQCTVDFRGAEVPAYYGDQVSTWIAAGLPVTLVPVGDTLEVISTRGGSGGVGTTYGPELLPNPSFEFGSAGPDGWSVFPWAQGTYTTARDTTPGQAFSGIAREIVTLSSGDTAPQVNVWNKEAAVVDSGSTYRASAYVRADAGDASLTVRLIVITAPTAAGATYFGTGASATTLTTVVAPGGAYQQLFGTKTIPVGHKYARVFIQAEAAAGIAASVTVSWDSASLRQQLTS